MTKDTHHKGLARKAQKQLESQQRQRRSRRMILFGIVGVVALAAIVWFVGSRPKEPVAAPSSTTCPETPPEVIPGKFEQDKPYPMTLDVDATYTATMKTSCGTMEIKLYPKQAPVTVNNFVELAKAKWYDGVQFHRIANDIDIIQTGDPSCTVDFEGCGSGGPGYEFEDELNNGLKFEVGTVAMANSGPDTNGSQIFIITGEKGLKLPKDYTVFGKVTRGLDVAQKIQTVPVGGPTGDSPQQDVWVVSVRVEES